jgi:cell division transport system permease protein
MTKFVETFTLKRNKALLVTFLCSFIALVGLGLLGILFYKLHNAERTIKESFVVEIVFNRSSSQENSLSTLSAIKRSNYCLEATFISKDSALSILKNEIGENAVDFLDNNPLYNSIQLHLRDEYVRSSSIAKIETQLKAINGIDDVRYSAESIAQLEKILPVVKISTLIVVGVLVFFILLVIFFITRLTLSFEKQSIESMKLFGATRWFIVKPFLGGALLVSVLSAILASITIFGIGYYMNFTFAQLNLMNDLYTFANLSVALILFSIVFIPLSTILALIRYLKF